MYPSPMQTLRERFFRKVRPLPDGCWEWTSTLYAAVPTYNRWPTGPTPAARLAWELVNGTPPPKGKRLERSCDNIRCVNPDHRTLRTDEERFWAFVRKSDSCWVWTGDVVQGGYGRFQMHGTKVLAHRMSYEIAFGAFDASLKVLHRCDNPPCVNPAHLWLGTAKDNALDAMAKGRLSYGGGKLTPDIVRSIRTSQAPARELASALGITVTTVYDIRRGKTWRNLP